MALVTGASRGIGRAIARALAAQGATVAISYREQAVQAVEAVRAIESAGGRAAAFQLDVRDGMRVKEVVKEIADQFGALAILVNNAGMVRDNYLRFMSQEEWDEVLHTNLTGAFLCAKAALSGMQRAKWGRIINMSSDAAYVGDMRRANYAAAKAGLLGLSLRAGARGGAAWDYRQCRVSGHDRHCSPPAPWTRPGAKACCATSQRPASARPMTSPRWSPFSRRPRRAISPDRPSRWTVGCIWGEISEQ